VNVLEILAPAKLNLGLEVIRRRSDGYHDISTVFQTISIFDRITIERAENSSVVIEPRSTIFCETLIGRSLERLGALDPAFHRVRIRLQKRIPISAGLGGGSSNAAAVLQFVPQFIGLDVSQTLLSEFALEIGSDVPFFLNGGTALATARGETLRRLRSLSSNWFVVFVPMVEIERKSATLFERLTNEDFTNGSMIDRVVSSIDRGCLPDGSNLVNIFKQYLYDLEPHLSGIEGWFKDAGAPFVALSGTGPAHYTAVGAVGEARDIAARLRGYQEVPSRIMLARPMPASFIARTRET
jgi:4-diphosphocytidyl-2-C-methyl-D-erythritol kinase